MTMPYRHPVHPGEILSEEFLEPMGLSPYKLARRIGVPVGRVTAIIHGKRAITADTALRLGRALNTSAAFWLNLQAHYDVDLMEALREQIEATIEPFPMLIKVDDND